MANENTTIGPRRVAVRIFKALAVGGALLLTIAVAAHFTYMYSGSGQWEKAFDQNGITVYTLKAPGSLMKRVRGVTRVQGTMNAAVVAMMSTATTDCRQWFPGCTSIQSVQPWNAQDRSWVHLFRMTPARLPYTLFGPRELLLKARATQDPQSKAVLVEYTAVPDEIPQNSCCYRVPHMSNLWRFTPLDNGLIEVENRVNMDIGIPYVLFNRFIPGGELRMLGRVQKYFDKKKGNTWEGIREKVPVSASLRAAAGA